MESRVMELGRFKFSIPITILTKHCDDGVIECQCPDLDVRGYGHSIDAAWNMLAEDLLFCWMTYAKGPMTKKAKEFGIKLRAVCRLKSMR